VAWLQPQELANINADPAVAALRAALPRGVLKQRVVLVDALPRHGDGSLDIKRLARQRDLAAPQAAATHMNSTEQALAEVWQELLGVSNVGPLDNFFELGGTSLMAMQAVVKLEQRIGKQISPRRYVIETLAQLAAAYDHSGSAAEPAPAQASVPAPRQGMIKRLVRLVQRA
jgi:acyl carrier protein